MQLHIISSFHYDYVYLQDSESYYQISFRILDKALEILEKEPDWCFTIEQTILVEEYLRRYPEKKSAMQKFIRQNRVAFAPGMYVMPDMNMIDAESLCLQAKYGKKFLQETFGCDANVCWIADCWGHHAQLPQILKACGYEGYFFWRCMRHDVKKNDFYWQGLDGSRIFTHWLAQGYAGLSFPDDEAVLHQEELSFAESSAENILDLMNKLQACTDDHPERPLLLCNGGDFRVPQASAPGIIRKLVTQQAIPPAAFSTPERFLQEVITQGGLSTVDGEFNGYFQGTYSTNIIIKQLLYYNREQLLAKETFAALTSSDDVTETEWKQLLRHFFHDTVCGSVCDQGRQEAVNELQTLLERSNRPSDFIFNPILRERLEVIETADGKHRLAALKPLESKKINGFPELEPLTEVTGAGCFENSFFQCSFDEKGRITSLIPRGGKELVNRQSPAPFGLPVMNRDGGDNWIYYDSAIAGPVNMTYNCPDPLYSREVNDTVPVRQVHYPAIKECRVKRSASECVIETKGCLGFWNLYIPFTLQISMDAYSPLIRFKLNVEPRGKYFRLRAAFPTTLEAGRITHAIPGGLQERPNGEYPADGFVKYSSDNGCLYLLNRGIPGNNVDENNVMLLSLFRSVAMEYKCDSTDSFNDGVEHTFEYAVLPVSNDLDDTETVEAIENYLRPLSYASTEYQSSWRPLPGNVRLLSLRKHPRGLFMRLCEVRGRTASWQPPEDYCIADALESVNDDTVRQEIIEFKPFELKHIVLLRN